MPASDSSASFRDTPSIGLTPSIVTSTAAPNPAISMNSSLAMSGALRPRSVPAISAFAEPAGGQHASRCANLAHRRTVFRKHLRAAARSRRVFSRPGRAVARPKDMRQVPREHRDRAITLTRGPNVGAGHDRHRQRDVCRSDVCGRGVGYRHQKRVSLSGSSSTPLHVTSRKREDAPISEQGRR